MRYLLCHSALHIIVLVKHFGAPSVLSQNCIATGTTLGDMLDPRLVLSSMHHGRNHQGFNHASLSCCFNMKAKYLIQEVDVLPLPLLCDQSVSDVTAIDVGHIKVHTDRSREPPWVTCWTQG